MKIALILGVTFATVNPSMLFRLNDPVHVSEEFGEELLNKTDESGNPRFAEVEDEHEVKADDAHPDGDNGDVTAPATVRKPNKLVIRSKATAAAAAATEDDGTTDTAVKL